MTIERSDDGRHWIAAAVPSLSALAGTSRPKARMLRLKIDAGSLPAEDMWP